MEQRNENPIPEEALDRSTPVHRFGDVLKRISSILPLILACLPYSVASQTAPVRAASSLPELATHTVPSPTPASAGATSAPDMRTWADLNDRPQKVIVIGFVGGFARGNDQKHPEVQFAEILRDRYGSDIFARVFANHQGRDARRTILRLLASKRSGAQSGLERDSPRIILYGHSWGAAETVVFARELGKIGIPVFLTIQVDSIAKPGHDDSRIPANVSNAINLYQSRGPLHGRTEILAAEPSHTTIIGNLHMTYEDRTINCDNYPWFARTFNRPHNEIENDPRVWDLAASLIASAFEVSGAATRQLTSSTQSSVPPPRRADRETTKPSLTVNRQDP